MINHGSVKPDMISWDIKRALEAHGHKFKVIPAHEDVFFSSCHILLHQFRSRIWGVEFNQSYGFAKQLQGEKRGARDFQG